ncbi:MAG: hypothetical protein HKM24_06935, partial [Gammaproteobacteria bacterium]|nr:hypothetical protein [Gammaproteobacteria bacterium]
KWIITIGRLLFLLALIAVLGLLLTLQRADVSQALIKKIADSMPAVTELTPPHGSLARGFSIERLTICTNGTTVTLNELSGRISTINLLRGRIKLHQGRIDTLSAQSSSTCPLDDKRPPKNAFIGALLSYSLPSFTIDQFLIVPTDAETSTHLSHQPQSIQSLSNLLLTLHGSLQRINVDYARARFGQYWVAAAGKVKLAKNSDVRVNIRSFWQPTGTPTKSQQGFDQQASHQLQHAIRSTKTPDVLWISATRNHQGISANAHWQHLSIPQLALGSGHIEIVGNPNDYRFAGDVEHAVLTQSGFQIDQLMATGSGDGQDIRLAKAKASSLYCEAMLSGQISRTPVFQADFKLQLANRDLSTLHPQLAGQAELIGGFSITNDSGISIDSDDLRLFLNEQSLSGVLQAHWQDQTLQVSPLSLANHQHQLHLTGVANRTSSRFDLTASVGSLRDILAEIDGQLKATAAYMHSASQSQLVVKASAANLLMNEQSLAALTTDATVSNNALTKLSLQFNDWQHPWGLVDNLNASFTGNKNRKHDDYPLQLSLSAKQNDLVLRSQGYLALNDQTQRMLIETADIASPTEKWQLTDVFTAVRDVSLKQVSPHCWRRQANEGELCIERLSQNGPSLDIAARGTSIPIATKKLWSNMPLELYGRGDLNIDLGTNGRQLRGELQWQQQKPQLRWLTAEGATEVLTLSLIALNCNSLDKRLACSTTISHPEKLSFDSQLEIDGLLVSGLSATVSGSATSSLTELGLIDTWIPEISKLRGSAQAQLGISGTLAKPQWQGSVALTGDSFFIPAVNVDVNNFSIDAQLNNDASIKLQGRMRNGNQRLDVTGQARQWRQLTTRDIELSIVGENIISANLPDLAFSTSPNVDITLQNKTVRVTGGAEINDALVKAIAKPAKAITPSTDVTVINRPEPKETFRYNFDLNLKFSDHVRLQAHGLNTNIVGELAISQKPGFAPTANGIIELHQGQIEMYGQILDIRNGRLIYSGPLDNPTLNIEVARVVAVDGVDVTVQMFIAGSAA